MSLPLLNDILDFGNLILSSANVIIGFSLFAYILTFNFRSPVARAFCALEAFVTLVYIVDVGMSEIGTADAAEAWLRFQWLGIAFVPAAYLHFSDALLRTTGNKVRWRRAGVWVAYGLGLVAFALVVFTSLVVTGVQMSDGIYHLLAGPLFWVFTVYYLMVSAWGWMNITRARAACLTSTSRRRMSYLMLAVIAPGLGVFPFLLIPTTAEFLSAAVVRSLTLAGNMGIALMTIVIAYIVAYQGVILPDRVVKHRLVHFLLRGPFVAIVVIVLMLTIPRVEKILGLPRDTVLIVTVAGSVVVLQVLANLANPAIDRVIYRRDRSEIELMQSLEQRLLTTTDLSQLLENTVVALCDLLRTTSGFIVTIHDSSLATQVYTGSREAAVRLIGRMSPLELTAAVAASRQDAFITNQDFVAADGYLLLPLRGRSDNTTLGILGFAAAGGEIDLDEAGLQAVFGLVSRAEVALEDMRLQQQVFALSKGLGSELEALQEFRSQAPRTGVRGIRQEATSPADAPGFVQAVKDALSQFWGGPKLTQSALLRLQAVQRQLALDDQVPAKALRSVLQDAIERLRPQGERSMTASEWVIYNILDLRFVQGLRIRDVARRLAMSESDYYRKQRIAIEQVADALIEQERRGS